MKIAVVYNRESQRVINLFGTPNQEKYGIKNIKRITDALKAGGHQVKAFEGDKDLVDRLEEFMPQVLKGERPGLVFNLSYGIQGQARYTHVPGILEMVGIPYVGSGPLAHSLALDKVVAKMIFKQHGVPTPDFAVLNDLDFGVPDLRFPLIVKPKNEAVSFGIRIVESEDELREAAHAIFERFNQSVLVEQYVAGREINVGLLGNNPPEALPPVELSFGDGGPAIYTYEDKMGRSGREVKPICPAPIDAETTARATGIARKAFSALGCFDCARVDMRMDEAGNLFVLEINSLPSLGARGSYVIAGEAAGLDFAGLCNRLVEVASTRYFGTPSPPELGTTAPLDRPRAIFSFLTGRRDQMERRVRDWVAVSSRTEDPVGLREASRRALQRLTELGLAPREDLTDGQRVWTLETAKGLEGGTLLMLALDVPWPQSVQGHGFRRDPELLYGEGVALSRGPLVMLEFALRALKQQKLMHKTRLGVALYADEGLDCQLSADRLARAAGSAERVLVLRPGNAGDKVITQRRGQRIYHLVAEGRPARLGQASRRPNVLHWFCSRCDALTGLTQPKRRIAVAVSKVSTSAFPHLLPHKLETTIQVGYPDARSGADVEAQMREALGTDRPWMLEQVADRPPMAERRENLALYERLKGVAADWGIPLERESSVGPSVAGLVPPGVAVVCGMGPVGLDLYTPRESIQRISLVQRTLLLAEVLASTAEA